jgi:hypothetical protein
MAEAKRDQNRVTTLIGESTASSTQTAAVEVNPTTGAVIVEVVFA